jgi:hypothetical protein
MVCTFMRITHFNNSLSSPCRYPGKIAAVHQQDSGKHSYDLEYLDGDTEEKVPRKYILTLCGLPLPSPSQEAQAPEEESEEPKEQTENTYEKTYTGSGEDEGAAGNYDGQDGDDPAPAAPEVADNATAPEVADHATTEGGEEELALAEKRILTDLAKHMFACLQLVQKQIEETRQGQDELQQRWRMYDQALDLETAADAKAYVDAFHADLLVGSGAFESAAALGESLEELASADPVDQPRRLSDFQERAKMHAGQRVSTLIESQAVKSAAEGGEGESEGEEGSGGGEVQEYLDQVGMLQRRRKELDQRKKKLGIEAPEKGKGELLLTELQGQNEELQQVGMCTADESTAAVSTRCYSHTDPSSPLAYAVAWSFEARKQTITAA